jgi:peptidoglycan/LPS O-acetylase OafA/YrhL
VTGSRAAGLAATIGVLTLVQLLLGTVSGWEQYDGKGFGWRLLAYPVLMLAVPLLWRLLRRGEPVPWGAVSLVWLAFLLDVSGNTADLFDQLAWWDDAMHFLNWGLLCGGLGLMLVPRRLPAWLVVLVVAGLGALLAIGWELGEWYTFIRRGVELDTAYEDTLGDLALGTLGATLAGVALARHRRTAEAGPGGAP